MTDHPERQYLDLIKNIMTHGDERGDRTGVGTLALFGSVRSASDCLRRPVPNFSTASSTPSQRPIPDQAGRNGDAEWTDLGKRTYV